MNRLPPRSTRTDTLFPYTTLFRSPITDMMDRRLPTRDIITPTSTHNRLARIVEREPWKDMVDMALLETMWNAAIEAAPTETTSYETIIAGAPRPVWTALGPATRQAERRCRERGCK